jgi:hypothetical protein
MRKERAADGVQYLWAAKRSAGGAVSRVLTYEICNAQAFRDLPMAIKFMQEYGLESDFSVYEERGGLVSPE